MAQFDVLQNNNPRTRQFIPYLLDVQSDLLAVLATRLVIPLVELERFGRPATRLNPVVTIDERRFVLSTAELAGVPQSALGEPAGSLVTRRSEILAAVDLLLTGV